MSGKKNDARTVPTAVIAAVAMVWALLVSAVVPAKAAAAAELPPLEHLSGSFIDLRASTLDSSLAVDPAGGEHLAIERWGPGYKVGYAYCAAANCVTPDQWSQVHLRDVHKITGPTQLRLTPQGKPRILITVGDANDVTTYLYAACDSGCNTAAGWTVLDLGSVFSKPRDRFGVADSHSFALDPQGRPRFVYSFQGDGFESGSFYYASCDTGCTQSVANWTKTSVGRPGAAPDQVLQFFYESLSLDFTSAGQARVGGFLWEEGVTNIAYLECDSACIGPQPVPPASLNWRIGVMVEPHRDFQEVVMRLDNNDVPNMIVGKKRVIGSFSRLRCASACTVATNWSRAALPFEGADADLVFDAANRPHVAFHGNVDGRGLDYARCSAACDTASATWKVEEIQDSDPFNQALPPRTGPCGAPGAWVVGYRPSLALDNTGNPRVSFFGEMIVPSCGGDLTAEAIVVRLDRFTLPSTVTPTGGGRYTPLTPARILDTRDGTGGISAPVGPGASVDVQVTGRGGVPATGVSAVAMNVTVTQPTASGWLALSPAGAPRPLAANLNFTPNQTVPNLVVVKVGTGGKVALFNSSGSSHVIFDVAGWYSEVPAGNDGRFQPLVPARILDTRDGTGGGIRLAPGASLDLQVSGRGGVPASGAGAAVLNVAVTGTTATSFLTVYPTGQPRPLAANLNYVAGDTVSNRVMAKLGTGGKLTIYNHAGSADVVVDVNGWYSDASVTGTSGVFNSLVPARILDTRDGTGGISGARAANTTTEVQITGRGGVPASGVSAVILNATVTQPAAGGFLTIFPTGAAKPWASDLNYAGGETRPNLVVVKVGTGGKVSLFTSAGTHVVFDVAGWMS